MKNEDGFRCVISVIEKVIKIIPETEKILLDELETYKNSLWNRAPETLYTKITWNPFLCILQKHITELDFEWKKKVVNTFNGQE
jgi:hypothetical protein